jgi:hypothetical protein
MSLALLLGIRGDHTRNTTGKGREGEEKVQSFFGLFGSIERRRRFLLPIRISA